LVYADDNLLGDGINIIKVNEDTLLACSSYIGLDINAEKARYMVMSHPNSGQNQDTRNNNKYCENMAKCKHLGTTLTNENDIHDEMNSSLNSENV
jgi:hypothetical protein